MADRRKHRSEPKACSARDLQCPERSSRVETRALPLRPHRQFVAVGIDEMEPPAAGEGEDRLGDAAAGGLDAALDVGEVVGIEDHERAARPRRGVRREAALQPSAGEFAISGAIVGERPADGAAIEALGALDVGDARVRAPFWRSSSWFPSASDGSGLQECGVGIHTEQDPADHFLRRRRHEDVLCDGVNVAKASLQWIR